MCELDPLCGRRLGIHQELEPVPLEDGQVLNHHGLTHSGQLQPLRLHHPLRSYGGGALQRFKIVLLVRCMLVDNEEVLPVADNEKAEVELPIDDHLREVTPIYRAL